MIVVFKNAYTRHLFIFYSLKWFTIQHPLHIHSLTKGKDVDEKSRQQRFFKDLSFFCLYIR